ncbi:MAG: YdgA family protein [Gammaproteobacteria bacterium]|nr:YdgA family protein [Gammaproteobacteria bacterium]
MKRFFLALAVLLIALFGGWLGAAYWAGLRAEQLYHQSLQQNSQDASLWITSQDYQRGLLSSEAVSEITLQGVQPAPGKASDKLAFSLKHDIYHGILPIAWWLRGDFKPRPPQVIVRTVLGHDAPWSPVLDALFGKRDPLTVVSYVALDGSSDNDITVPFLDVNNRLGLRTLNFSGLEGRIHSSPLDHSIQGELSAKGLYALLSEELGRSIRLTDLQFSVNQRYRRFNFPTGDSDLKIATLTTANLGDTPGTLTFTGLRIGTHVQEQGDWVDSRFDLAIDDTHWDETAIGSFLFKLSANKLDGAMLESLQRWSRQYNTDSDDSAAVQQLMTLLPAFLKRNPELQLTIEANAPQGQLRGEAQIVFQQPAKLVLYNPAQLLGALSRAEANLSIAKALLESSLLNIHKAQMVAEALREGREPDEDPLTIAAQLQTQEELARWINTRWLLLEDDTYRAQARFEQGRFYLNGIELPLPL